MNATESPILPMSSSHSGQPLASAGSTCSGFDSAPGVGGIENLEACSLLTWPPPPKSALPPAPIPDHGDDAQAARPLRRGGALAWHDGKLIRLRPARPVFGRPQRSS